MIIMSKLLGEARVAATAALADKKILESLSECAFPPEKIAGIIETVEKVNALNADQSKELGEQLASTEDLNTKVAKANDLYMKILKFARIAFAESTEIQTALQLFGRRKVAISAWYNQAEVFYKALLGQKELVEQLGEFGVTLSTIEEGYGLLKEITPAQAVQNKEISDAQAATATRDAELEKLSETFSKFKKVCRIIFRDDKDSMTKMGFK